MFPACKSANPRGCSELRDPKTPAHSHVPPPFYRKHNLNTLPTVPTPGYQTPTPLGSTICERLLFAPLYTGSGCPPGQLPSLRCHYHTPPTAQAPSVRARTHQPRAFLFPCSPARVPGLPWGYKPRTVLERGVPARPRTTTMGRRRGGGDASGGCRAAQSLHGILTTRGRARGGPREAGR